MDAKQVEAYIKLGLTNRNNAFYKKLALGPVVWSILFGFFPGAILGGWHFVFVSIALVCAVGAAIIVILWSKNKKTIFSQLKMQSLGYTSWIVQILTIQILFYTMEFGFDFLLLALCVSAFFPVFFVGIRNAQRLRKGTMKTHKLGAGDLSVLFFWIGFLAFGLIKNFLKFEMSQASVIYLIVSLLSVLSCALSFGLLSFQKIYYLKKWCEYLAN